MNRIVIVGENFVGSIMAQTTLGIGSEIVRLWDQYQETQPDSDDGFIPWLSHLPGFALDPNPNELHVVMV